MGIQYSQVWKIEGDAIAKQCLRCAQSEKHGPALSLQCDADIDEAEDEPLRYAAVKSACGKKGNGNSDSNSTAMAVAPIWMRLLRILNRTITAIAIRLMISSTEFKILRPMGRVNISAIMQMPVTMRNIRSYRLIR